MVSRAGGGGAGEVTRVADEFGGKRRPSSGEKTRLYPPRLPEDGQERRKPPRSPGRRPRRSDRLYGLLSFLFAFVAGFSAVMCLSIAARSVRTARLNREMSALHAAYSAQPTAEPAGAGERLDPALLAGAEEIPLQPEEGEAAGQGDADAEAFADAEALADAERHGLYAEDEGDVRSGTEATQTVRTTRYHADSGEALPEMARLREENSDLVAWLSIEGVLDLPVCYRDNRYYLTHDFHRQENASGTIFLDEGHPFSARACNLLLHGHNMKDGSMFGHLVHYGELDYLRRHPIIEFSTLWQKERYVIFAVLRVSLNASDPRFFNYFSWPAFETDELYSRYVRDAQLASLFAIPVSAEPSDAMLTLSTCEGSDRLVVLARRFRAGENVSDMRALASSAVRQ